MKKIILTCIILCLNLPAQNQDPKLNQLIVDNRVFLTKEQLSKIQVRLTVVIELLYLTNNKLDVKASRPQIEKNNQAFKMFGYPELARKIPPVEPDSTITDKHEVPLNTTVQDETKKENNGEK